MPYEGQELHGQDGYRLRLVSITQELLEMEAIYGGTGQMPPLHLHPGQSERFEVLEGTVRAVTAEFFETLYSGEIPADFLERFSAEVRFA